MVILQLEEQPPLIQAVFSGEIDQARNLLDYKEDVNYQDYEKRSALHAAAFRGDAAMTKLLIEHGARVNTKDCKWLTPLHRACCNGSEETVSVLLSHSADTSARDRQWQTPLHIAAAHNAVQCVSYLLDRIPNPNVTDRSGRTALHHAVLNGHNEVADLLISRGCIVNACDKKDCRPIHWAAHMGHLDTIELLVKNGADINAKDRNQYTPLHVSASSGMVEAGHLLVLYGAHVDAQNAYGNTPLHIACLNGHLPVCQDLVKDNANREAVNYRGQTPIHIAAASTHGVHCLNFLVNLKVDINKQSLDGRTPLHMTAIHGRFTRSKTLIDRGADVDCVDKNGCTALHIAAQHGHELLSNTLLQYGADASKKGFEGRTPLHMCCLSGYVECCRVFIKNGVDVNARDDSGKTPTHCAAYKGSVECIDLLVSSGADFRIIDNIGRTALHYAAAQGYFSCVFTLVGVGGSVVNHVDAEGCTALHLAAAYDLEGKCVDYLIQHKADPKLKDSNGFTPIHYAAAGNNVCGLKYLLDAVGNNYFLYGQDMPLTTPLHIAAKNGNMDILETLMPYFPNPNICSENGCTPLILAARQGFANCVQLLLRFGAKVSICDSIHNMSPVHHSAKNGHVHSLALLVDNTEDKSIIDLPDGLQRTALMLAVSNSHTESVTTLLKSGADLNILDADSHSCLFRSVVTGHHNIIQLLLPHSTTVNKPDIHGKTVLHIAAACGRVTCVQRILHFMDKNVAAGYDNNSFTALHWACYSGSADCVSHLLKEGVFNKLEGNLFSAVHCATSAGSDKCLELLVSHFENGIVKMRDMRNRTPLHIAALHGHTECAKYLLEQGAEIDSQDEDNRTPLIAAAQNGQVQVIAMLISFKADVTLYDNNGNTALHMACLQKHNHAALFLLDFIEDPYIINMINNDRRTPLHLSARNGLVDVTRQLIMKGSSVMAVDADGLTPALACAPNPSVAQCLAIILASHPTQSLLSGSNGKGPDTSIPELEILKANVNASADKLKRCKTEISQTDISLVKNPDQFELEQMFEMKFVNPDTDKHSRDEVLCVTSSIVKNFFSKGQQNHLVKHIEQNGLNRKRKMPPLKMISDMSCFIIENYNEQDDSFAEKLTCGRDLHKSQSDMTLVTKTIYSEEDYGRIIQNSKVKLADNDVKDRGAIRKNCQFDDNKDLRNIKGSNSPRQRIQTTKPEQISPGKPIDLGAIRKQANVDASNYLKRPHMKGVKRVNNMKIDAKKEIQSSKTKETFQKTFQDPIVYSATVSNPLDAKDKYVLKKFLGLQVAKEPPASQDVIEQTEQVNVTEVNIADKHLRHKGKEESGGTICPICIIIKEAVIRSGFRPDLCHLQTELTPMKEALIYRRNNNRCLRAFLDNSYELTDKNRSAVYHGMLSQKCEPCMSELLKLPKIKVSINPEEVNSRFQGIEGNSKCVTVSQKMQDEVKSDKIKVIRPKDPKLKDNMKNKPGQKSKTDLKAKECTKVKGKETKSQIPFKSVESPAEERKETEIGNKGETIKIKEGIKVKEFRIKGKMLANQRLGVRNKAMDDKLKNTLKTCIVPVYRRVSSSLISKDNSKNMDIYEERHCRGGICLENSKRNAADFIFAADKKKQSKIPYLSTSDVTIRSYNQDLSVSTYIDGYKIDSCGENTFKTHARFTKKTNNHMDAELKSIQLHTVGKLEQNHFQLLNKCDLQNTDNVDMPSIYRQLTSYHTNPMFINDNSNAYFRCHPTYWCFPEIKKEYCNLHPKATTSDSSESVTSFEGCSTHTNTRNEQETSSSGGTVNEENHNEKRSSRIQFTVNHVSVAKSDSILETGKAPVKFSPRSSKKIDLSPSDHLYSLTMETPNSLLEVIENNLHSVTASKISLPSDNLQNNQEDAHAECASSNIQNTTEDQIRHSVTDMYENPLFFKTSSFLQDKECSESDSHTENFYDKTSLHHLIETHQNTLALNPVEPFQSIEDKIEETISKLDRMKNSSSLKSGKGNITSSPGNTVPSPQIPQKPFKKTVTAATLSTNTSPANCVASTLSQAIESNLYEDTGIELALPVHRTRQEFIVDKTKHSKKIKAISECNIRNSYNLSVKSVKETVAKSNAQVESIEHTFSPENITTGNTSLAGEIMNNEEVLLAHRQTEHPVSYKIKTAEKSFTSLAGASKQEKELHKTKKEVLNLRPKTEERKTYLYDKYQKEMNALKVASDNEKAVMTDEERYAYTRQFKTSMYKQMYYADEDEDIDIDYLDRISYAEQYNCLLDWYCMEKNIEPPEEIIECTYTTLRELIDKVGDEYSQLHSKKPSLEMQPTPKTVVSQENQNFEKGQDVKDMPGEPSAEDIAVELTQIAKEIENTPCLFRNISSNVKPSDEIQCNRNELTKSGKNISIISTNNEKNFINFQPPIEETKPFLQEEHQYKTVEAFDPILDKCKDKTSLTGIYDEESDLIKFSSELLCCTDKSTTGMDEVETGQLRISTIFEQQAETEGEQKVTIINERHSLQVLHNIDESAISAAVSKEIGVNLHSDEISNVGSTICSKSDKSAVEEISEINAEEITEKQIITQNNNTNDNNIVMANSGLLHLRSASNKEVCHAKKEEDWQSDKSIKEENWQKPATPRYESEVTKKSESCTKTISKSKDTIKSNTKLKQENISMKQAKEYLKVQNDSVKNLDSLIMNGKVNKSFHTDIKFKKTTGKRVEKKKFYHRNDDEINYANERVIKTTIFNQNSNDSDVSTACAYATKKEKYSTDVQELHSVPAQKDKEHLIHEVKLSNSFVLQKPIYECTSSEQVLINNQSNKASLICSENELDVSKFPKKEQENFSESQQGCKNDSKGTEKKMSISAGGWDNEEITFCQNILYSAVDKTTINSKEQYSLNNGPTCSYSPQNLMKSKSKNLDQGNSSNNKDHIINWKLYLAHRNLLFENKPHTDNCFSNTLNAYKKFGTEDSISQIEQKKNETPSKPKEFRKEFRTQRQYEVEDTTKMKVSPIDKDLKIEEHEDGVIKIDDILENENRLKNDNKKVLFSNKIVILQNKGTYLKDDIYEDSLSCVLQEVDKLNVLQIDEHKVNSQNENDVNDLDDSFYSQVNNTLSQDKTEDYADAEFIDLENIEESHDSEAFLEANENIQLKNRYISHDKLEDFVMDNTIFNDGCFEFINGVMKYKSILSNRTDYEATMEGLSSTDQEQMKFESQNIKEENRCVEFASGAQANDALNQTSQDSSLMQNEASTGKQGLQSDKNNNPECDETGIVDDISEETDVRQTKNKKSFPSISKLGKKAKKDSNCKIS